LSKKLKTGSGGEVLAYSLHRDLQTCYSFWGWFLQITRV